jgi:single-strand DNA-binding protein
VVIYGTLQQRSWETDQGERRSKVEILADDVAPSLKWATASVTKNERSGGSDYRGDSGRGGGFRGDSAPKPAPARSESSSAGQADLDDEPF